MTSRINESLKRKIQNAFITNRQEGIGTLSYNQVSKKYQVTTQVAKILHNEIEDVKDAEIEMRVKTDEIFELCHIGDDNSNGVVDKRKLENKLHSLFKTLDELMHDSPTKRDGVMRCIRNERIRLDEKKF